MAAHAFRRLGTLALCCMLAPAFTAGRATAQAPSPPPLEWSGEVDFTSHYVWHGIQLSEGAVLNPSLTVAHRGWSLNLWTNLDRDPRQANALDEIDLTLAWSASLLGLEFAPSLLYATFPNTGAPVTTEAHFQVSCPLHGPFSAFTHQAVELEQVRGAAWSAAGLAFDLPEQHHVALSGNVQYGRGWWKFASVYADPALEGLNVASAGLSAVVAPPGAGFTLRPHVDWYGVGNAGVKDVLTGSSPWVFGLALCASF